MLESPGLKILKIKTFKIKTKLSSQIHLMEICDPSVHCPPQIPFILQNFSLLKPFWLFWAEVFHQHPRLWLKYSLRQEPWVFCEMLLLSFLLKLYISYAYFCTFINLSLYTQNMPLPTPWNQWKIRKDEEGHRKKSQVCLELALGPLTALQAWIQEGGCSNNTPTSQGELLSIVGWEFKGWDGLTLLVPVVIILLSR